MIPFLVVEGVAHKVEGIDYLDGKPMLVTVERNGRKMFYWDKSMSSNPNALDLENAIHWKGRYDTIIESLYKRIEAHEEIMIDLNDEHMRMAKNKEGLPFVDVELRKIERQHEVLECQVDGLHEAVGIIMLEDVDLSGGEEID